jgi:hypothetical protein
MKSKAVPAVGSNMQQQRPQWRPLPAVWAEFAERHPELFVGTAASARSRFCSRHGEALKQAGALVRTPGGAYYANDRFVPLAWALTMGLPSTEGAA